MVIPARSRVLQVFPATHPLATTLTQHPRSMFRRTPRLSVRTFRTVLLATAAFTLAACGDDDDPAGPTGPTQDIVALAASNAQLSTLVSAVQAAGLAGTLSGTGPFTVFAPTNAAFDALPAGTVTALLESGNADVLTALLTYHVVPGALTAAQLQDEVRWLSPLGHMAGREDPLRGDEHGRAYRPAVDHQFPDGVKRGIGRQRDVPLRCDVVAIHPRPAARDGRQNSQCSSQSVHSDSPVMVPL